MAWYPLYYRNERLYKNTLGTFNPNASVRTNVDIDTLIQSLRDHLPVIHELEIDKVVTLMDKFGSQLANDAHWLNEDLKPLGLSHLAQWLRQENLFNLLNVSLRGDRRYLDSFLPMGVDKANMRTMHAQPRGLVVHWISGNIPLLGFLSLLQGILTKNVNIVKASSDCAGILPAILEGLSEVSGSVLTKGIAIIYADRDDKDVQEKLSIAADARVAWGGKEAVETISGLPKRIGAEDVVFGPKYSYMVIGRECLKKGEKLKNLAIHAAFDISIFDQQGCNSPHTVFVEEGGETSPIEFAEILASAMAQVAKIVPKGRISTGEASQILNKRAEYDIRGMAYYSAGTEWTVLYSDEDKGLADACFSRVIFVRPVSDVMDAAVFANHGVQSIGLAMEPVRRSEFAERATFLGAERCPPVGEMSLHESPWDGMFMTDRLVRWVTSY